MALPLIVVTDTYLHSFIDPERMKGWVWLSWKCVALTQLVWYNRFQTHRPPTEKWRSSREVSVRGTVNKSCWKNADKPCTHILSDVPIKTENRFNSPSNSQYREFIKTRKMRFLRCFFFVNKTFYHACLGGAIGSVAVRPRAAWLRWSASLGRGPGWPDHCVCKYI